MMMIPIDQVLSQAGFIHLENHQQLTLISPDRQTAGGNLSCSQITFPTQRWRKNFCKHCFQFSESQRYEISGTFCQSWQCNNEMTELDANQFTCTPRTASSALPTSLYAPLMPELTLIHTCICMTFNNLWRRFLIWRSAGEKTWQTWYSKIL